jgi:hypothetical protein
MAVGLVLVCCSRAAAQDAATPANVLRLDDLRAFRPQAGNWQIVGDAAADRNVELNFTTASGTGVLANLQTETARDHLITAWEHADLELDLEVMMPRGSNSGLYFQGRYEIQLLDSWGRTELSPADIGGIYERWDEARPEGQNGYEGHAPPINVARAPGLWQHLNIVFRAPRFDAAGKKIRNAAFLRVALNGVVLHENAELSGPTRAAAFENEAAMGPLMIQGDHGPVAFRRITYRTYLPETVTLSDLRYTYYKGRFDWQMPDLADLTVVRVGPAPVIDAALADTVRRFALRFEGKLDAPVAGDYVFEVAHSARVRLEIDGNAVLSDQDENGAGPGEFARRTRRLHLSKGTHPIALTYAKGNWHGVPTALGLFVSGPGLLRTELSAPSSLPRDAFSAYEIVPEGDLWGQRNFVIHRGGPRSHAISVGHPAGIHYNYDLGSGALLHLWKGKFANAATMWYERGDLQSALPLGSVIELAGWPTIALLSDDAAPWPTAPPADFRMQKYQMTGRPWFKYQAYGLQVNDQVEPHADGTKITRLVSLSGKPPGDTAYVFLAEADRIDHLPSGAYAIDDRTFYIENLTGGMAFVRQVGGKEELLVRVDMSNGGVVRYDLVW